MGVALCSTAKSGVMGAFKFGISTDNDTIGVME